MKNANELFADFCDVDRTEQAGVHPQVLDVYADRPKGWEYVPGYSTAVIRAIMAAARLLREDPDVRLAQKQLPLEPFKDDGTSGVLAGIINSSLARTDETGYSGTAKVMHACAKTEGNWAATLWAPTSERPGIEIYADETKEPAFVRKGLGRESALSLKPVKVAGVEYPALSVMRLEAWGDTTRGYGADERPGVDKHNSHVRPSSDIKCLTYLRPSVFGAPVGQREVHFESARYPVSAYDPLTAASISHTLSTFLPATDVVYFSESNY